ncbi:MAG: recombinase family protein [Clostridia bacterium]|nr:recombinase family protein [Clostridia bacterium]
MFGYNKFNEEEIKTSNKKRICGYFIVSKEHKISPVTLRLRTEDLQEEISLHDDWILESVIWDACSNYSTDREGLNLILEKARNDDFDMLLVNHISIISRNANYCLDYAVKLVKTGKTFYGMVDGIKTLDDINEKLHLSIKRKKQFETFGN